MLIHEFPIHNIPVSRYYYFLHFTGEETGVQAKAVTYPGVTLPLSGGVMAKLALLAAEPMTAHATMAFHFMIKSSP